MIIGIVFILTAIFVVIFFMSGLDPTIVFIAMLILTWYVNKNTRPPSGHSSGGTPPPAI